MKILITPETIIILLWNLEHYQNSRKEMRWFFKKLTMTLCQQITTSLSFFWLTANLEQFGSWIPNVWSIVLSFSSITIFSLTKVENRTKKVLNTALILSFWKKILFLYKNFSQQKYWCQQNLGGFGTLKYLFWI